MHTFGHKAVHEQSMTVETLCSRTGSKGGHAPPPIVGFGNFKVDEMRHWKGHREEVVGAQDALIAMPFWIYFIPLLVVGVAIVSLLRTKKDK